MTRARRFRLPLLVLALFNSGVAQASPWEQACARLRALTGRASPPAALEVRVAPLHDHLQRGVAIGFAGGAAVQHGDRLLLNRGYGLADWHSGLPMTADTVFDIGSVSKQFTAAAILRLEEQGRLSVNDPITRFFGNVPAEKAGITIHQLLTHSAGFALTSRASYQARDRAEMVAAVLAEPLQRAPGERYGYSNAGYALLAAIVEIASGEPYEVYLRRELWLPAGMERTGWTLFDRSGVRFATGYNAFGGFPTPNPSQWTSDGPLWGYRGPGSLLSTMNDLRRWATALRRGRILSEQALTRMITPHIPEEAEGSSYYGYGLALSMSASGECTVGHNGGNNLHYNALVLLPERNLVVQEVSLQANSRLRSAVVGPVRPILLGGRASALPALAQPGVEVRRLAGWWRSADGTSIRLFAAGGRLLVPANQPGAARLFTAFPPLDPADERLIAASSDRLPSIVAGIATGDYAPLLASLSSETTADEERRYWPTQWREWTGEHGAFQGSELIGSLRREERLMTYVLLRFSRRNIVATAYYDRQGRVLLGNDIFVRPEVEILPSEYVLTPAAEGTFRVHNLNFPDAVEVRIDPSMRVMTLHGPRGTTALRRADFGAGPGHHAPHSIRSTGGQ
jgi:CubicO group peptidase (beta-lactamase class C family)